MAQYVYLLQEQDFSGGATGLYKIGKTTQDSIEARTKQYKAGNARPVVEYHSAIVHDCQEVETALHRQYKQFRLKAGGGDEWYEAHPTFLEVGVSMLCCDLARPQITQTNPASR
jgi:hypothetical protein